MHGRGAQPQAGGEDRARERAASVAAAADLSPAAAEAGSYRDLGRAPRTARRAGARAHRCLRSAAQPPGSPAATSGSRKGDRRAAGDRVRWWRVQLAGRLDAATDPGRPAPHLSRFELPDWKRAALRHGGMGHAAKLHVPLARPAPTSAVVTVPGPLLVTTASSTPSPVPRSPQTRPERIARVRRGAPPRPRARRGTPCTTWPDGAYRRRRPRRASARRRRLHFAGERAAGPWAGLMEGALRSPRRSDVRALHRHPRERAIHHAGRAASYGRRGCAPPARGWCGG